MNDWINDLLSDAPKCQNVHLWDLLPACQQLLMSRVLGLGLLVLGSALKLPLLWSVLKTRSAKGLSMGPLVFEVLAWTLGIALNLRAQNPFSTYGEGVMILLANLIILMIHVFESRHVSRWILGGTVYAGISSVMFHPTALPDAVFPWLMMASVPLFLGGGPLQIYHNHKLGHMGSQSEASLWMGWVCGMGRMYTTWTQIDDWIWRGMSVLGAAIASVMMVQMMMYRSATREFLKGMKPIRKSQRIATSRKKAS